MELARGGILVAGGVAFEFGAVVSTFEDGLLRLQTQFTLTPDGPQIAQTAGENVTQMTDQLLSQLSGTGAISDPELAKNSFVTEDGAIIMQQLAQGQLVNLLVNTESNVSWRQDTDITIKLHDFSAFQADVSRQLLGMRMAHDLNAVTVGF